MSYYVPIPNNSSQTKLGRDILRWLILLLVVGSGFCFAPQELLAQQTPKVEAINVNRVNNIKAIYLSKFSHYATWPESANVATKGYFTVGVLGTDPLEDRLDKIAKAKQANGLKFRIKRFETIDQYEYCHILFIPSQISSETQIQIIQKLKGKPVLLVGETPGFCKQGGHINFHIYDRSVKFEINTEVVKQSSIDIKARLLKLAKPVTKITSQN